ncbi:hypothetical protein Efla_006417 [Eimeria flavescens]
MSRFNALLLSFLAAASCAAVLAAEEDASTSPFKYVTANLLAQLLVLLLLLMGSCVGVVCLLKINTPTMFSDKPLVINKEY